MRVTPRRQQLTKEFSKSQVDRLGDRLRRESIAECDLRSLDEYRHSFGDAYAFVVQTIRSKLRLEPTGRPAKSTISVVEKLQRESVRLSQMQDIAGCRIVVKDVLAQEKTVADLLEVFPEHALADRRVKPSFGYRAVHVVVRVMGKPIEVQARSHLQHLWAEFSEKLADMEDPSIKYGGGPKKIQNALLRLSKIITDVEINEATTPKAAVTLSQALGSQEKMTQMKDVISELLQELIGDLDRRKERRSP